MNTSKHEDPVDYQQMGVEYNDENWVSAVIDYVCPQRCASLTCSRLFQTREHVTLYALTNKRKPSIIMTFSV